MKDFSAIKEKFVKIGMQENNIDYAIDSLEYGTDRNLIIKNLTSNFRNESEENATQLINDLIDNIKGLKRRLGSNSYYSARQLKIYNDYKDFSNKKLLAFSQANKLQDDVIEIINDILIERNLVETRSNFEVTEETKEEEQKQRHIIITVYLALAIIVNSLLFLFIIISSITKLNDENYELKVASLITSIVIVMNIYFITKVLQWKKFGFKGIVYMSVIQFFVNLFVGVTFIRAALGLLGFVILYFLLQIEKNKISAWDLLE